MRGVEFRKIFFLADWKRADSYFLDISVEFMKNFLLADSSELYV